MDVLWPGEELCILRSMFDLGAFDGTICTGNAFTKFRILFFRTQVSCFKHDCGVNGWVGRFFLSSLEFISNNDKFMNAIVWFLNRVQHLDFTWFLMGIWLIYSVITTSHSPEKIYAQFYVWRMARVPVMVFNHLCCGFHFVFFFFFIFYAVEWELWK